MEDGAAVCEAARKSEHESASIQAMSCEPSVRNETSKTASKTSQTASKTSQKPIVYRVQGIPLHCGEERDALSILGSILKIDTDTIRIRSLAISIDGRTRVATVEFSKTPLLLQSQSLFKIPDGVFEREIGSKDGDSLPNKGNIVIDDDFGGLTVLYPPVASAKHRIEYFYQHFSLVFSANFGIAALP